MLEFEYILPVTEFRTSVATGLGGKAEPLRDSPRRRLVYISSLAVPHQIKLCGALQAYYDAKFWFYEFPDRKRGNWWRTELGPNCKVLDRVYFFSRGWLEDKYLAFGLLEQLRKYRPDILILGGFSIPANMIAYWWAKKNGKTTIVFTERSRDRSGTLRRRSLIWKFLRWWYRDIDRIIVSAEDAVGQFRDELGFGEKVVAGQYAADLEQYFRHPFRGHKSEYTFLYANRLTEIYDPLLALRVFAEVVRKHPGSRLLMNASGELAEHCRVAVSELGLDHQVEFLTGIASWDSLHEIYARSDILILPAAFSSGNFTVIEAMASGMGVVVSDRVLSSGRLIKDGVNGFSCSPSVEAFVERIERYIAAPELLESHARINREIAKGLGVEPTAAIYFRIIESISQDGSAS